MDTISFRIRVQSAFFRVRDMGMPNLENGQERLLRPDEHLALHHDDGDDDTVQHLGCQSVRNDFHLHAVVIVYKS